MKLHKNLTLLCLVLFSFTIIKAETYDTIPTISIEDVVIQSTRMNTKLKNIPQRVEIITAEDLQSIPNDNLAEIVKRLTNLDIVQYPGASASVGMRGFSPSAHARSYARFLINGKPAGTINLATILPTSIERIEVIKGPYATLYGSDAMGGVLNIITKSVGTEFSGNIQAEAGSSEFGRLEGGIGGTLAQGLRGRLAFSAIRQGKDYRIGEHNLLPLNTFEKTLLDEQSYGDTMLNTCYDLSVVDGRLEWDINNRWKATGEASWTYGKNVETPGNYWGTYGYSKKQVSRVNTRVNLERSGKWGIFSLSPYFSSENEPNYSDNTASGYVNYASKISEFGLQVQQQWALGALQAVTGADLGVYDYHSERFESDGTPASPYKPDNSYTNAAVFAQASWHRGGLDVNAGLRFDHFRYLVEANSMLQAPRADNSYFTLNPSLGLQYQFDEGLRAHGSFGTAFSVPDAYKTAGSYQVSLYYGSFLWAQSYKGNPDLKPEHSRSWDAGLSYHTPDRALHADLTYFRTLHTDKIVETYLNDGTITFTNANHSNMDGLELSADYDLGSLFGKEFSLKLYTNWTWLFHANLTRSTTASTGGDSSYVRDLQYVRKLNGNGGLSFRNQMGITARLNLRYNGSRLEPDFFSFLRPAVTPSDYTTEGGYTSAESMLKYPDFLIADLSVGYRFRKNWNVGLVVSNLFDENYTDVDGYNLPGREVRISLGYDF